MMAKTDMASRYLRELELCGDDISAMDNPEIGSCDSDET